MLDRTMTFSFNNNRDDDIKAILTTVYNALQEKGYNPINQITMTVFIFFTYENSYDII